MAYTINNIRIVSGFLTLPRIGRPVFVGTLEETSGPLKGTAATIDLDGFKFVGTIQWAAQEAKTWWNVRWVGGKNKLGEDQKQKFYASLSLGEILKDRITVIGEEYQASSTPMGYVKRMVIPAGPGWKQLEQILIASESLSWRILSNGKLTVIKDDFPDYKTTAQRLDYDPKIRLLTLEEDFGLLPGVTLPGYTWVDRVTHRIGKISATEVSFGTG